MYFYIYEKYFVFYFYNNYQLKTFKMIFYEKPILLTVLIMFFEYSQTS